jgi:hypothetical protein
MPWVTSLGWLIWSLSVLAGIALGMVIWAFATGKPKGPPRPVRTAQHSREVGAGDTQRLNPPATLHELPGLSPDSFTRREDLPWNNRGKS